jgi:DNA-binding transcriptional ArsR family regulator
VKSVEDLSRYYSLLKDPTRRKIIEVLGTQEKIGFKELRDILGLGVGTVYYHLDMLSSFVVQDKHRKYSLNDRGHVLFRVLKEGSVPANLELNETFSHRVGKWLFLSPLFAKTTKPLRLLPVSVAIMIMGALGSAYAELDPALFFYNPYPTYGFTGTVALFFFDWIGLFIFAELSIYVIYRRAGNDLQLFTCMALASFPIAIVPYLHLLFAYALLPTIILQYVTVVLQIWSLLLFSAAFCFGKGIRLDKAVVVSLTAMYLNIAILFLQGRLT